MIDKKQPQENQRFEFGKNWQSFIKTLDNDRISLAKSSLNEFLKLDSLVNKTFLDIGSGSGLFSLAARQQGAIVHSFDYDTNSVSCTQNLKSTFFPDDNKWVVEQGSILDRNYLSKLGQFDICYAWGVLHHTNHLWQAIFNAQSMVKPNGLLYIAIYNDQGITSSTWCLIKKIYNSNDIGKVFLQCIFYPLFFFAGFIADLIKLKNPQKRYSEHKKNRGMSLIHDWKDWLGGYPFETAPPYRVNAFLENLNFKQVNFKLPPIGFGNNQYLFQKIN